MSCSSTSPAPSASSSPGCWGPNWRTCRWTLPSSHGLMIIWRTDRSMWDYTTVCLTVWSATSVPSMELCCLPSSSPPTLQILSNAVSRVICRNSLMTRTLVGQTLTLWIHANTWVWCWTIIWSGLQMQRQSTRIYRYSISLLCHLFRCCVLGWGHQGEGCKQT